MQFCLMVKTQFETCFKKVRSDNETEFTKGELQNYFLNHGMLHETSVWTRPMEWLSRTEK